MGEMGRAAKSGTAFGPACERMCHPEFSKGKYYRLGPWARHLATSMSAVFAMATPTSESLQAH